MEVRPADFTLDKDGNPVVDDADVNKDVKDLFSDEKIMVIDTVDIPPIPTIEQSQDPDTGYLSHVDMTTDTNLLAKQAKEQFREKVIAPIVQKHNLNARDSKKLAENVNHAFDAVVEQQRDAFNQKQAELRQAYTENLEQSEDPDERMQMLKDNAVKLAKDAETMMKDIVSQINEITDKEIKNVSRQAQTIKAEHEKKNDEDIMRAHLRGFTRTIPSFVMAYGDRDLRLSNFDDYTEDDVFHEVTGITEEEFRLLRDGGDYRDEVTGEKKHYDGHVFDETVFNDAIQEFLNKKEQLANYFDDSQTEDIFDYIPPQKTNQIFTPRWVVEKMVDELEQENPGCFDNPDATFADLFMKSGLYITEIVKRLYRSERMKQLFPDGEERIKHIFEHQVYGMAPTRIIYLIATNFILGFDDQLKSTGAHFVQADAAEAAKSGTLQELVDEKFGK